MDKILLISEETLKTLTVISDNVDGKYITSAIIKAQEIDLEQIIGLALRKKLESLVANNQMASNPSYKNLLDEYITPFLANQVAADVQLNVTYKVNNSGVVQNNDDKKSASGKSDVDALRTHYENVANAYGIKLRNHLCANASLYPEYRKVIEFNSAGDPQLCGIVFD